MKTVSVRATKNYNVVIGHDLLDDLGTYAKQVSNAKKAAIISDSNVWPLYGQKVNTSLISAGFETCSYVFAAGEASKSGSTYLAILNFLAENRLTRTDLVIALGGGVTGDLTGFALWALSFWGITALFGKKSRLPAVIIGQLLCYACGTAWMVLSYTQTGVIEIMLTCVMPYLLPDALKITLAWLLAKRLMPRIC